MKAMLYRNPETLRPRDVCPHCKKVVDEYVFFTPCLNPIHTYHCRECGDVIPVRSAIANGLTTQSNSV